MKRATNGRTPDGICEDCNQYIKGTKRGRQKCGKCYLKWKRIVREKQGKE